MKNISFISLILILWFNMQFAYGQSNITIKGKISDSYTNTPIPFVNISLLGSNNGTTSNLNGEFIFNFMGSFPSIIQFSHLTFYSKERKIESYADTLLEIHLSPIEFRLSDVSVFPYDAQWIITKAMEKIEDNYYPNELRLKGFYREVVKEDTKEIQHIEAILDVYKAPVQKSNKDRISLNKGIVYNNVAKSDLWDYISIVNSPYELLHSDISRHPNNFISVAQNRINFLNKKDFKFYNYSLIEKNSDIDNDLYLIYFTPKKKPKKAVYEGIVYIDKNSFSILKIEFFFNTDRVNRAKIIDYYTQSELLKAGVYIKAVNYFSVINYKYFNNRLVLSQSNMGYDFVFVNEETKSPSQILARFDFVTNEIDTSNVIKFKSKNWLKHTHSLDKQIKPVNEEFWGENNFIPIEK